MYLHSSNNNRAATVLQSFEEAVNEYGFPSRVRADKGGENVDVSWFMLNHPQRGPGRESMITGLLCFMLCFILYIKHEAQCLILLLKRMILEGEIRDAKRRTFDLISKHSLNINFPCIFVMSFTVNPNL